MSNNVTDFLVIGAGVSGLALAGDLQAAGHTVLVVDKGRRVGGRAATRRFEDGTIFDYGAQYFTARGDRFVKWVGEWANTRSSEALAPTGSVPPKGAEGELAIWNHGYPVWQNGAIQPREPGHPRYAPTRGMNQIGQRLAQGLTIETSTTVTAIERTEGIWTITGRRSPEGEIISFSARTLALTLPAEQLLQLAGPILPEETRERLEGVAYEPAWTLVLRLTEDVPFEFTALEFKDHPVFSLLARDHTKRHSPDAAPVLVAHAKGEWARDHFESDRDTVQAELIRAVEEVVGKTLTFTETFLHRWRYALPTQTFGASFWYHPDLAIAGCGDACGGIRLENALTTGWQLAAEMLKNGD